MRKICMVLAIVLSLLLTTVFSFAAPAQSVVLVNPIAGGTVYSSNLLISVKVTQPQTIKVKVFEEKQTVNGTLSAVNVNTLTTTNGSIDKASFTSVSVTTPASFTCTNNLSFYTKQINDLKPGLYRIQIETLDDGGKIKDTYNNYVVVKEKEEANEKIFESSQSGTMQFLQNLLKTIFNK